MGNQAPLCMANGTGCRNRTWHPSGMCYPHLKAGFSRNSAPSDWTPPTTAPPRSGQYSYGANPHDPSAIMDSARGAFPEMSQEAHPRVLRDQVVNTLQSAVGIEAYRRFPETANVEDSARDEMLKIGYADTVRGLVPSPVTFSDHDATMIARSSDDQYGRGLDESRALASYGLRKEWELARSLGFTSDENRVPYGDDFNNYCFNNQQYFSRVVSDEYVRQMNHYHDIVADVNGRYGSASQYAEPPMTRSAPSEYDYVPSAQYQNSGEGASEAVEALKSIGKLFGKAAWNGVRSTPRKVNNFRERVSEMEAESARHRRESEDNLIREEAVYRAKADRARRTGSLW